MRARGAPGAADFVDHLSLTDILPLSHMDFAQMSVDRHIAIAVGDHNELATGTSPTRVCDSTLGNTQTGVPVGAP